MKTLKHICVSLLIASLSFIFSACNEDCAEQPCECHDQCEGILHFSFDLESPLAFQSTDIDTIMVTRVHKENSDLKDTIELHWLIDQYKATGRSPVQDYHDQCRQRDIPGLTIGFLTPFSPSIYDEYDYNIIVPGIKTFQLRHIVEEGEYYDEFCCKCYYSNYRSVKVDGREYSSPYYFDIFLSR
jgi:hypothetical protein